MIAFLRRFNALLSGLAACLCCGITPVSADIALWSLQDENGGRAVLMGTVHLLPKSSEWQTQRVRNAVKQADALVLETLLDGPNTARVRAFAMQNGFFAKPDESLPALLSKEDMIRLRAAEEVLDVPTGVFDRMRPWFAALNMSLAYAMSNGFETATGTEHWLRQEFEKKDRAIGPLEAPSAGLEALSRMRPDVQIDMLRSTIAQVEAGGDDIEELYAVWKAGDIEALGALMFTPEQFHPDVHAVVLVERNANWVTPLLDYLKTPEEELIAVGAAHMIGPGNLLDMLREAGVTVERLE